MTPDYSAIESNNAQARDVTDAGLILSGLDGTNPLGFLAAIGVSRIVTMSESSGDVRMKWTPFGGTWVPEIFSDSYQALGQDAVINILADHMARNITGHPAQLLHELKTAGDVDQNRRKIFEDTLAQCNQVTPDDRHRADWLAAFMSDIAPSNAINQLQTARRDYYYRNLVSIIEKTRTEHLRRALFHQWDYADPLDNQSLHLDPSEDRRHAHQWHQPSGDPNRKKSGGMLGANRLAIEAIPLFTSLPESGTLRTIGFTGHRSTDTRWTWPIWSVGITLPVIRSLLLTAELQQGTLAPAEIAVLRERGVVAAYRTDRILVEKTPNFTPARRIA